MVNMKTNVSIKYSSIEEYRDIEKKLVELGYVNDSNYTEEHITILKLDRVTIFSDESFWIMDWSLYDDITYNSLEEFLKD